MLKHPKWRWIVWQSCRKLFPFNSGVALPFSTISTDPQDNQIYFTFLEVIAILQFAVCETFHHFEGLCVFLFSMFLWHLDSVFRQILQNNWRTQLWLKIILSACKGKHNWHFTSVSVQLLWNPFKSQRPDPDKIYGRTTDGKVCISWANDLITPCQRHFQGIRSPVFAGKAVFCLSLQAVTEVYFVQLKIGSSLQIYLLVHAAGGNCTRRCAISLQLWHCSSFCPKRTLSHALQRHCCFYRRSWVQISSVQLQKKNQKTQLLVPFPIVVFRQQRSLWMKGKEGEIWCHEWNFVVLNKQRKRRLR